MLNLMKKGWFLRGSLYQRKKSRKFGVRSKEFQYFSFYSYQKHVSAHTANADIKKERKQISNARIYGNDKLEKRIKIKLLEN